MYNRNNYHLVRKQKICLVSYEFYPYIEGGAGVSISELAYKLAQNDYSVTILTLGDAETSISRNNIEIIYFRRCRNKILKLFLFQVKVLFWLKKNINNFDLIHFFGSSGFLSSLCLKPIKTPSNFVTSITSDTLEALKVYLKNISSLPTLKRVTYLFLIFPFMGELFSAKISDLVIVPNKELKFKLFSYGISPDKIVVIPEGVNKIPNNQKKEECREKLNLSLNKRILLFVGRLIPEKGLYVLFKAFNEVIKRENDVILLLIGDGVIREELEKLALEFGISNNIIFEGYIKRENLPLYYKSSDIFILPSFTETFGIVLLEASVYGLPLVVSELDVFKAIIKEGYNGLFFRKGDENDLVNNILYLLNDKKKRTMMNRYSEVKSREFSWDKFSKKVMRSYNGLMSEKHCE